MTVMDAPARDAEQPREALAYANRCRYYRAQLKRDLASGEVTVSDLRGMLGLDRPHALLEGMRVRELLLAVPGFGQYKVGRLLRDAGVGDKTRLVGLTRRQRLALADGLMRFDESARRGGRMVRSRREPVA